MIHRKFGTSGIDVSAVGIGTWAFGGWAWPGTDETKAIDAIHAALDRGINLLDTAPTYGSGRSEELVGRAIRGCSREKIVLATKCGLVYDNQTYDRQESELLCQYEADGVTVRPSEKVYNCLRPDSIREELECSLKRLGTAYIDIYQTHWQTATTPIADTMAALLKLKEQGKIRAIGVSNVSLEQLNAYGPIDSAQEKFSMIDRGIQQSGILPYCRQHGVAMLAYSPLAHGLLSGKIRPNQQFRDGDVRKANPRYSPANVDRMNAILDQFRPIADRHKATVAQLVIAWTFSQPGVTSVLCGARDPQHAIENAAAGEISLSADEVETMDEILAAYANRADSGAP